MNSEPDKQLERQIDRALKALPELPAPATLAPRVLAIIGRQSSIPWYRQAWQSWPVVYQRVALALLMALFGGLCLGSWGVTRTAGFAVVSERVGVWTSMYGTIHNTLRVLWDALVYVIQHVGTGWVVGCAVAAVVGYAMCLSLGALCVRLALAQSPVNGWTRQD